MCIRLLNTLKYSFINKCSNNRRNNASLRNTYPFYRMNFYYSGSFIQIPKRMMNTTPRIIRGGGGALTAFRERHRSLTEYYRQNPHNLGSSPGRPGAPARDFHILTPSAH